MHVILAVFCALIGAVLDSTGSRLFHALVGAAVGLGVAEFMALRSRLGALEHELKRLRQALSEAPSQPVAPVAYAAPPMSALSPFPKAAFAIPDFDTSLRGGKLIHRGMAHLSADYAARQSRREANRGR